MSRSYEHNVESFKVLGGLTYLRHELPDSWQNETPLLSVGSVSRRGKLEQAPLDVFPLIEDFELRLQDYRTNSKSAFGYHIYFFSPTLGYLADFPWWDHTENDLKRDDFRIPLGDFDHPFDDVEQGWEIDIAEQDDFVYILQGDFGRPEDGYHTWFKVHKDRYLAAWQKAIAMCREMSNPPGTFLLGSGDDSPC